MVIGVRRRWVECSTVTPRSICWNFIPGICVTSNFICCLVEELAQKSSPQGLKRVVEGKPHFNCGFFFLPYFYANASVFVWLSVRSSRRHWRDDSSAAKASGQSLQHQIWWGALRVYWEKVQRLFRCLILICSLIHDYYKSFKHSLMLKTMTRYIRSQELV